MLAIDIQLFNTIGIGLAVQMSIIKGIFVRYRTNIVSLLIFKLFICNLSALMIFLQWFSFLIFLYTNDFLSKKYSPPACLMVRTLFTRQWVSDSNTGMDLYSGAYSTLNRCPCLFLSRVQNMSVAAVIIHLPIQ